MECEDPEVERASTVCEKSHVMLACIFHCVLDMLKLCTNIVYNLEILSKGEILTTR